MHFVPDTVRANYGECGDLRLTVAKLTSLYPWTEEGMNKFVMRSLGDVPCIILPVFLSLLTWCRNPRGLFFGFLLLCFRGLRVRQSSQRCPIKPRACNYLCILWKYSYIGCYHHRIFLSQRGFGAKTTHHCLQGTSFPLRCLWMLGP